MSDDAQTCSSYEWQQVKAAWADRRLLHVVWHGGALLLHEIDAVLYRAGRWLGVNR